MPKSAGVPKSILADINKLKTNLAALEKSHNSFIKEYRNSIKSQTEMIKKAQSTLSIQQARIAGLGKWVAKKEKRKPSEYNLFLKEKMSQGMSMVDAVKAWKQSSRQSVEITAEYEGHEGAYRAGEGYGGGEGRPPPKRGQNEGRQE